MLPQQKGVVAALTNIFLQIVQRIRKIDIPPQQIPKPQQHPFAAGFLRKLPAKPRKRKGGRLTRLIHTVTPLAFDQTLPADRLIEDWGCFGIDVRRFPVGKPYQRLAGQRTQPLNKPAVVIIVEQFEIEGQHCGPPCELQSPAFFTTRRFFQWVQHTPPKRKILRLVLEWHLKQRKKGKIIAEGEPREWAVCAAQLLTQSTVNRLVGFVFTNPHLRLKGLHISKHSVLHYKILNDTSLHESASNLFNKLWIV